MRITFYERMLPLKLRIVEWKGRNGLNILRVSLGIVFFWFGALKFFAGLSPAEVIAGRTILKLTFGRVRPDVSLPILACWECSIGLGLITKKFMNAVLILLYFQMAGTLLPLFFFPHDTFTANPLVPTLLGQYIIKNLVLISGGIVIGATVEGGQIISNPDAAKKGMAFQSLITRYRKRFHQEPEIKNNSRDNF